MLDRMAFMQDKTCKQRSVKQETRLAKGLGGKKQPGSGNTIGRHGDVDQVPVPDIDVGKLRLEAKTTKHDSFKLNRSDLLKIEEQAAVAGRIGAMLISFEDMDDYVVIRKDFLFGAKR
jgi:hypothetical protein